MKKAMVAVVAVLLTVGVMFGCYVAGAMSVIHSDGWVEPDREQFVVDWAGSTWAWDISEE